MSDLVVDREIFHQGSLIMLPGEYVCSTTVDNLSFQFVTVAGFGLPTVKWVSQDPSRLQVTIAGDLKIFSPYQFSLSNVATVRGRRISLAGMISSVGQSFEVASRLFTFNFWYEPGGRA